MKRECRNVIQLRISTSISSIHYHNNRSSHDKQRWSSHICIEYKQSGSDKYIDRSQNIGCVWVRKYRIVLFFLQEIPFHFHARNSKPFHRLSTYSSSNSAVTIGNTRCLHESNNFIWKQNWQKWKNFYLTYSDVNYYITKLRRSFLLPNQTLISFVSFLNWGGGGERNTGIAHLLWTLDIVILLVLVVKIIRSTNIVPAGDQRPSKIHSGCSQRPTSNAEKKPHDHHQDVLCAVPDWVGDSQVRRNLIVREGLLLDADRAGQSGRKKRRILVESEGTDNPVDGKHPEWIGTVGILGESVGIGGGSETVGYHEGLTWVEVTGSSGNGSEKDLQEEEEEAKVFDCWRRHSRRRRSSWNLGKYLKS